MKIPVFLTRGILCAAGLLIINGSVFANYYEKGCQNYIRKKYDIAREMFLKEVEINGSGNAYYFLGEIEKNKGNLEKAEEYFRESISKNTENKYLKLAYWNLIVLVEQRGKYDQMVKTCRELWDKLGDGGAQAKVETLINKFLWTDSVEAVDAYNAGIEYKNKNMSGDAKNEFNNAIQYDSDFLAPKFELGLIFYREDNVTNALYYLNDVIDEIPFYGELHLLLGDIYYKRQLYQYSINHYNQAMEFAFLDRNTEYTLRLQRGTSLFKTGDYENSVIDIQAAGRINNRALEPLLILSAVNIKNNRYNEALESLKNAEKISPGNPEILFQIGSVYYKLNDEKYIATFERLLDILSARRESILPKYMKVFVLLLKNNFVDGKYEKAAKIIELLPDNMKDYDLTLIAAKTYHNLNRPGKAIENFEKLSLSNDDKFLLAINYARNDMDDKAKNILMDLFYYQGYAEKAKLDNSLRKIASDIEKEKIRLEEEKKRLEEERKRLEAERLKLEEEKRREEEKKRLEEEKKRIEAEKEAAMLAEEAARKAGEERKKQVRDQEKEKEKLINNGAGSADPISSDGKNAAPENIPPDNPDHQKNNPNTGKENKND